ncbi:MAG: YggS family pyridoxal phosphate-dependent enzyme [Candidatus Aureabacteria bacterium]|nr:YggS family pyridoxal phosphate-dependent enzyme [Candidatus Auribacterota bacterium]
MIADNLKRVRERIAAAAERSGRSSTQVELVVAAKGRPIEEIEEAIRAGVRTIGESKVQEAKSRFSPMKGRVALHMIGHLQRNKVRDALRMFDMIHSVDSLRLAEEIEMVGRETRGEPIPVLLEVNISGENKKYGFTPDQVLTLAEKLAGMTALRVEGLMTMAPLSGDAEGARSIFARLRALAREVEQIAIPNLMMRHLSMGMTQDFEVAVEEGATMVRVGTAIFAPGEQ